jgi:hypothetical protein
MPTYFNIRTPKKDLLMKAITEEDKTEFVAAVRNNLTKATYFLTTAFDIHRLEVQKKALNKKPSARNSFLGVVKKSDKNPDSKDSKKEEPQKEKPKDNAKDDDSPK